MAIILAYEIMLPICLRTSSGASKPPVSNKTGIIVMITMISDLGVTRKDSRKMETATKVIRMIKSMLKALNSASFFIFLRAADSTPSKSPIMTCTTPMANAK